MLINKQAFLIVFSALCIAHSSFGFVGSLYKVVKTQKQAALQSTIKRTAFDACLINQQCEPQEVEAIQAVVHHISYKLRDEQTAPEALSWIYDPTHESAAILAHAMCQEIPESTERVAAAISTIFHQVRLLNIDYTSTIPKLVRTLHENKELQDLEQAVHGLRYVSEGWYKDGLVENLQDRIDAFGRKKTMQFVQRSVPILLPYFDACQKEIGKDKFGALNTQKKESISVAFDNTIKLSHQYHRELNLFEMCYKLVKDNLGDPASPEFKKQKKAAFIKAHPDKPNGSNKKFQILQPIKEALEKTPLSEKDWIFYSQYPRQLLEIFPNSSVSRHYMGDLDGKLEAFNSLLGRDEVSLSDESATLLLQREVQS